MRSRNTTSPKVASTTTASPREVRSRVAKACFSAMFHATTANTAASAASGTKAASGAATSMNSSRKAECSIPATGPRAPERTLVAVRAMVPVTQNPPNSAAPTFAAPCATNSQLERCRRPLMESATTAESRLSMPPSSAKESAVGNTSKTLSTDSSGSRGAGRDEGMPPKRLPIVSTGKPNNAVTTAAEATAIRKAGHFGRQRRSAWMEPTASAATAQAHGFAVGSASASAASFGNSGPGSFGSVRPSNSLSWLAKMMTAMPAVNPTVTG